MSEKCPVCSSPVKVVGNVTKHYEPMQQYIYPSFSLRQYYAGLAMQGILSNNDFCSKGEDFISKQSILHADALVKVEAETR